VYLASLETSFILSIHVQRTGSELRDQDWAAAVKTRVLRTSTKSITDTEWILRTTYGSLRIQNAVVSFVCLALSCTLTYPLS
jgi:hypothetical protein